jgi:hypothetical protein
MRYPGHLARELGFGEDRCSMMDGANPLRK